MAEKKPWDPWKMFDLTAEQMKVEEEKRRMRAKNREIFRRKVTDPFDNEMLFDPTLTRFNATRALQYKNFRFTKSTTLLSFGIIVVPIVICAVGAIWERNEYDRKCRNMEVDWLYRENPYRHDYEFFPEKKTK